MAMIVKALFILFLPSSWSLRLTGPTNAKDFDVIDESSLTDEENMWIALDGPNDENQFYTRAEPSQAVSDKQQHKLNRPGCKAIVRSNYVCTSRAYSNWLLKWEDALNELQNKVSQVKNPKRILMLGDSTVNQIYASLACLHHDDISSFQAIKFDAASLPHTNEHWSELQWPGIMDKELSDFDPSGDCQEDRSCSNQVSKFQLRSGLEVYLIYNHPVEYFNSTQLESMLRRMHLKPDSLDIVAMGHVHENRFWVQTYLFGQQEPPAGAWTVDTIGDFLYHNDFTGRYIILPGSKHRASPHDLRTKYADKFSVAFARDMEFVKEPKDAKPFPRAEAMHLCVPGPLDWLAASIAHGA